MYGAVDGFDQDKAELRLTILRARPWGMQACGSFKAPSYHVPAQKRASARRAERACLTSAGGRFLRAETSSRRTSCCTTAATSS